jgi:hypothetical protein
LPHAAAPVEAPACIIIPMYRILSQIPPSPLQGAFDPNKSSGVGTNFWLLY